MESGRLAVVAAVVSLLAVCGAHATTYDLAGDFSLAGNPNGPYTYGSTTTLGGVVSIYANSGTYPVAETWGGGAGGDIPNVFHNYNAFESTDGFTTLRPGQLAFHPSFGDLHSVIRFTVPATGLYEIDAAYEGVSNAGTTSSVFILMNSNGGAPLFAGNVNGFRAGGPSYVSPTLTLTTGDTIDFVVSMRNGDPFSDSTGIDATITYLPEPGMGALFAAGLLIVGLRLRAPVRG
jgi:hypothetical protein